MVQVIESELEISRVLEPISLPFEGFDLAVDSFHKATRHGAEVLDDEPMTLVHEGCGDLLEFVDVGQT